HRSATALGTRLVFLSAPFSGTAASRRATCARSRSSPRAFRRHGHRQSLSPLSAAPPEHVAATGRCHAGEKSMRSLSLNVAGLIRSFHKKKTPSVLLKAQVFIRIISSYCCQF